MSVVSLEQDIYAILSAPDVDLARISAKRVRKQLVDQGRVAPDFVKDNKTDIDALMSNPLGQPIGTLTANILGEKAGVALLAINFFSQFGCGVAFVSRVRIVVSPCAGLSRFTVRRGVAHLLCLQPRQGAAVLGLAEQG